MNFLLDADMPRCAMGVVEGAGHTALDSQTFGLRAATDDVIADFARAHGYVIVTRDGDFGDMRNYPPRLYSGIVVLDLPDDAVAATICRLLHQFLDRQEVITRLPGRLAVVQFGRVRLRPMP